MDEDNKDNINSNEETNENLKVDENQSQRESSSAENNPSATSGENQEETQPKIEENNERMKLIHKKDGRLHIYVRQDKYKGELKSKNFVGRLYIDGKQKISSSGTPNLEEAIPILEKWFDDIHGESTKGRRTGSPRSNRRK